MDLNDQKLIRWIYAGKLTYSEGLSLQDKLHKRVSASDRNSEGFLVLLEHFPVITLGRFGDEGNILSSPDELKKRGVEIFKTRRGGDATFHGPGQLVGYPIINLRSFNLGAKSYVLLLEQTLIAVLEQFGIPGERRKSYPGVWVGLDKIAAIGVRVKRGIAMHGFSLSVSTDMSYFSLIVPCGISDGGVTSLKEQLNVDIPLKHVARVFIREFERKLGVSLEESDLIKNSSRISLNR